MEYSIRKIAKQSFQIYLIGIPIVFYRTLLFLFLVKATEEAARVSTTTAAAKTDPAATMARFLEESEK